MKSCHQASVMVEIHSYPLTQLPFAAFLSAVALGALRREDVPGDVVDLAAALQQ